jgi:hypothetical protein
MPRLRSLNPGGHMLIANFAPYMEDIGFMEAFMNWHLIYRSFDDIGIHANALPENELAELQIYPGGYDEHSNFLLYLESVKARLESEA